MSNLRKVLTRKVAATGFAGALLAGGIGVAAAQTLPDEEPVVDGTQQTVEEVLGGTDGPIDGGQDEVNTTVDEGQDSVEEGAGEADGAIDGGQDELGDLEDEVEQTIGDVEDELEETTGNVEDEVDETTGDIEDEVDEAEGKDNFGARVSADARGESDGVRGVDGQTISAEARAKGEARRSGNTGLTGGASVRR